MEDHQAFSWQLMLDGMTIVEQQACLQRFHLRSLPGLICGRSREHTRRRPTDSNQASVGIFNTVPYGYRNCLHGQEILTNLPGDPRIVSSATSHRVKLSGPGVVAVRL